MSEPTIEEKSRRIVEWLEKREPGKWWQPGECDIFLHPELRKSPKSMFCIHGIDKRHEIPPPDLTSPEWFLWLLKATRAIVGASIMSEWFAQIKVAPTTWSRMVWAATPELALINALYQLAQRGEP